MAMNGVTDGAPDMTGAQFSRDGDELLRALDARLQDIDEPRRIRSETVALLMQARADGMQAIEASLRPIPAPPAKRCAPSPT